MSDPHDRAKLRDFNVGFFEDAATKDAVVRVAESSRVTIFAGAGAGADQGLPNWSSLVSALLGSKLQEHLVDFTDEDVKRAATTVTSQYYQVPTATILDQLYRETNPTSEQATKRRNDDVQTALYRRNQRLRPSNPSLIEEILTLAYTLKAANVSVHIVTTNYDNLFERFAQTSAALQEFGAWDIGVRTYADSPPSPTDDLSKTIPIVHIHGFLPEDGVGKSRSVVFSEGDYIEWEDSSPFRNYLANAFGQGTVLLVGTSLRDNNIAAKLRNFNTDACFRCAVLPAQEDIRSLEAFGKNLAHVVANYAVTRGHQLGVQVLRPDFYGQVVQFLREIAWEASRARSPDSPSSYVNRLEQWAENWGSAKYKSPRAIDDATSALGRLAATLNTQLGPSVTAVKIELWVRAQPHERALELWVDSTARRSIDSPGYRRHTLKIDSFSEEAVIKCFANRSAYDGRLPGYSDRRWTHFLATPIDQAERVPVGVAIAKFYSPGEQEKVMLQAVRSKWAYASNALVAACAPLLAISESAGRS